MTKPQLPPGVIPIGATHFHHNPVIEKPTSNPWRKKCGDGWLAFYDGEWRGCNGSKANLFVAIEDVLGKAGGGEWDGEGVPPVGTICEWMHHQAPPAGNSEWRLGDIRYVSDCTVVIGGDNCEHVHHPRNCSFRPIRTAEQIAAEERTKALEGACEIAGCSVGSTYGKIVELIIDAGYRKQVQE